MREAMEPMNDLAMQLKPIGVIHSPWTEPKGTPIQPAMAEGAEGTVELFEEFLPALKDLDGFERIWLVYWFHRSPGVRLQVKPFMDRTERGLFACRAPCRPNPIGISPVRLLRIAGNVLHVADIDILDDTPLLDIKPYAPRFDCFPAARSGWLDAARQGRTVADDRFAEDSREE